MEKKNLIAFGISKHLHLKLSGDFTDCVPFEASFGRHTVHQGSFYYSRTIFQMLLHYTIICNTMSSTISRDLSEYKVNLHTFSRFVIIEFNRLIKNWCASNSQWYKTNNKYDVMKQTMKNEFNNATSQRYDLCIHSVNTCPDL